MRKSYDLLSIYSCGRFIGYKFNYINMRKEDYRVHARKLASLLMDPTSIRAFEDRHAKSASAKAENVLAFLFWQRPYRYNNLEMFAYTKCVYEMVYIYRYEKCIDVIIYL